MMPVMNGKELANRLSVLRPGVKVLFISGYAGNILAELSHGDSESFLPKPFSIDILLEKIAGLMGKA
jgi:two-component system, cell cycle sensor histidine kinase and response regulator CckA